MRQEYVCLLCLPLYCHNLLFLVLRLEPTDKDALQTKLFLLLQTEQYNAALTLIDQGNEFLYEKAYALYRANHESEAREALAQLKKSDADERGILHLEAQLVRSLPFLILRPC